MKKNFPSRTVVRILCALFVLISTMGTSAVPSAQAQAPAQQSGVITDTWAVQVQPGTDPDQLAAQMGAENLGQIGSLTGYYLFRIPGTDSDATAMADVFVASSQVLWFEQQVARQQSKRLPSDPLYPQQWHLADANVQPAWAAGYTGDQVTIAIVDDGLQHAHPDLSAQYKSAGSWDFNGNDNDPSPVKLIGPNGDYHGTAAAGVAAADNDGASCGVGVAYDAGLAGIRLISDPVIDAQEAAALNYQWDTNSIYSNSWGPADDGATLLGPGPLTQAALQSGVTTGRGGKGSIYVWAAGNGGLPIYDDNVNYDGYANSRFTIAVGAVGDNGIRAPYSEPGAAMLVTAPSSGNGTITSITTTDLVGNVGYNLAAGTSGDCGIGGTDTGFGGTSSAAPLVSGVVALMLEANQNLGWRDVQYILAQTAVKNDPTDAGWDANPDPLAVGVQNNGAGLHVNHKYGFGLVDAAAAVAMAKTWVNVPAAVSITSPLTLKVVNAIVPDNNPGSGVPDTIYVSQDIDLEHVEVVFNSSPFNASDPYRGDLEVVLTSPSGTQSILAEQHTNDEAAGYNNWKFMTVRNWGESSLGPDSLGDWTLTVTDERGGSINKFVSWQLILHGKNPAPRIISGNTGVGNINLSYMDGTLKTTTSLVDGSYSISVPKHWSGTVTPSSACYTFTPDSLPYSDVISNQTAQNYDPSALDPLCSLVDVNIGNDLMGSYALLRGQEEKRVYYNVSGGPVIVKSLDPDPNKKIIAAIRLQSFANNTLYSFVETMGVPESLLSYKYYFPTYNNIWPYLNSQLRFANINDTAITVKVTIGTTFWTYPVAAHSERREYLPVNGGPVIIESTDSTKKIIAAIRLQSFANNTLYSFAETMGIPVDQLSDTYYFPTYNNTWDPLNSQLRFANINDTDIDIQVTIGTSSWTYPVAAHSERREYLPVNGGPVIVKSLDPDPNKKIIAAIRLQSFANDTLYSFVETMGVPESLLSYKYNFPTYNNTWPYLNSQLRFANINDTAITVKVTIGTTFWTYPVAAHSERREYLPVNGGPVIIESTDSTKKIIAAIRLQSFANNTLYSFAETMGIADAQMSSTNYFPSYNNIWAPLNSQLRFAVP